MPLVRIDILEGRPREKLGELHGRVSALVEVAARRRATDGQ